MILYFADQYCGFALYGIKEFYEECLHTSVRRKIRNRNINLKAFFCFYLNALVAKKVIIRALFKESTSGLLLGVIRLLC